jgi:tRNA pseudouridine38-40 synthase
MRMRNIRLTVAYDGTDFHGFQIQPRLRTVQGVLQDAIRLISKEENLQIQGSGRTDAGVHAWGQVVNFHTRSRIPVEKWPLALNARLPKDLVIRGAEEVPLDFHARFSAKRKVYRYRIDRSPSPDVFQARYAYHVPYPLEIERMREASLHFLGRHDFTSFCVAATPVEDKVREIYRIQLEEEGTFLLFTFEGEGFLWNMVRILVGTLLLVGRGRLSPDDIPEILEARDRTRAGFTAPAHGLTLWEVIYP